MNGLVLTLATSLAAWAALIAFVPWVAVGLAVSVVVVGVGVAVAGDVRRWRADSPHKRL